jgi:putative ATPase
VTADEEALAGIARYANGDARVALNTLETAVAAAGATRRIDATLAAEVAQSRALLYDKTGEEHYNLISALHKSMRNSDPDAAVYWLARMIEAGEDPLYIARRLVRFASEDIGNADPRALSLAIAAKDAVHFMGMPEGNTALAQATIYMAVAAKSNAVYRAYLAAAEAAAKEIAEPVPLHLRNAPTPLMKELEYGKGYRYAHDETEGVAADMVCLPPAHQGRQFYEPPDRGLESEIRKKLEELRRRRGLTPTEPDK